MPVLSVGDDSYFLIDGEPHQRGSIIPVLKSQLDIERPAADNTGYVSLRRQANNELYGRFHYSSYRDGSTGDPFADYNALITWIAENCFAGKVSAGGSSGIAFTKTFYIKAVPAAPNEKAAGDTFTDAWLIGGEVTVLKINNVDNTGVQIDHDNVTGEIGPTGSFFSVGDTVVIFKN